MTDTSTISATLAWAREQPWWEIACSIFMQGGQATVFVPTLLAALGPSAAIRHKRSGGVLNIVTAPIDPWGIVIMPPGAKVVRPVELGNLFKNIPIGEA